MRSRSRCGLAWGAALAAFAAMLLGGGYALLAPSDPARLPPHPVRVAIFEHVRDFVAQNAIPLHKSERTSGFYLDLDQIADSSPFTMEGWIALTFEDGPQGFALPPGRVLNISQTAGVIEDFSMTLSDAPKTFDETRHVLEFFLREVTQKGWRPDGPVKIPQNAAGLERSGVWTIVAQMTDAHGNRLEVRVIDYGLAPKQESWILVPLGRTDTASASYLVQVSVYEPEGKYLDPREAVYPRRLFANGNTRAELRLRAWFDDPGWSPAAHGMAPISAAERRGDVSFWRMPAPR